MVLTDAETIQQVNQFITQAFNYFNGKINVINKPARLFIDWRMSFANEVAGTCSLPDVVKIFPSVILQRYTDPTPALHQAIVTIVHELFHVDQYIDYPRFNADNKYHSDIERTVENETVMFMAQHLEEIEKIFGVHNFIDPRSWINLAESYKLVGHQYHRVTYQSHMMMIIRDMMGLQFHPLYDVLEWILNDSKSKLSVSMINYDLRFVLKDRDMAMPIQQLNKIFYDLYFQYNYHGGMAELRGLDKKHEWLLFIKTRCNNKLYRVVK